MFKFVRHVMRIPNLYLFLILANFHFRPSRWHENSHFLAGVSMGFWVKNFELKLMVFLDSSCHGNSKSVLESAFVAKLAILPIRGSPVPC